MSTQKYFDSKRDCPMCSDSDCMEGCTDSRQSGVTYYHCTSCDAYLLSNYMVECVEVAADEWEVISIGNPSLCEGDSPFKLGDTIFTRCYTKRS